MGAGRLDARGPHKIEGAGMTEGDGRGSYDAGSGWPGSPGSSAAAAQAGGIPFRPLSLGEIFNGAITSMRQSPAATLGMAALLSVGGESCDSARSRSRSITCAVPAG